MISLPFGSETLNITQLKIKEVIESGRTVGLYKFGFPTTPMYFEDMPNDYSMPNGDLFESILWILDMSMKYRATDGVSTMERNPAKRSTLDIWRHLSVGYPDVTLWDVMRSIYTNQDKCASWVCGYLGKRVFQTETGWVNWMSSMKNGNHKPQIRDEFGLTFPEWSEI
jgi:hypothetical protein